MMDATNILLVFVVVLQVAAIVVLLERGQRNARAQQAQRSHEAQVHDIMDRAPVMLWAVRSDTTLSYINNTCVEFAGLRKESLLNDGWLSIVHPDDQERCIETYVPAFEARQPFLMEYRMLRADGVYRWILDTGVPSYGLDGNFAGYVGCSADITERRFADDLICESRLALEGKHREVQQLAGRLITAHEDERRRLARELHDDLTQRLARLAIDAGQLEHASAAPGGLRGLREDLVRLSEDVHALSYRLHPSVLDDLGLVEALKAECDRVARHGPLRVDVDAKSVPLTLRGDASLCLFRIAQEALSNAARHANATAVTVHLAPEGNGFQLAVRDDGDGFDPRARRDHPSLGLASMRERVRVLCGEFDIDSAPGRGTTVVAWVPA